MYRTVMRTATYLASLVAIAVLLFWLGRTSTSSGTSAVIAEHAESLYLYPAELSLGDHRWNQRVPFQLALVNDTTRIVEVAAIETPCGCTLIDRSSIVGRPVPGKGRVIIDGTLDTQVADGPKERAVMVVLTSGERLRSRLTVNVVGSWRVSPDLLDFGQIAIDGTPESCERWLRYSADSDLHLGVRTDYLPPWLSVFRFPSDGFSSDILVRILPDLLPDGQSSADITLETSDPDKPTGVIFARAIGVRKLRPQSPRCSSLPGTLSVFESMLAIIRKWIYERRWPTTVAWSVGLLRRVRLS